jgi:3-oxoadipate enol-lactonase
VTLHYRLDGPDDAPVLALAASLGTTLDVWEPCLPSWNRLRVLRFDLRGHGGSDAPPGPYAVADLGRDVLELLDRLELPRVAFCGTSLGGAVGLWLAAEVPERIDPLVVAFSSARFGESYRERAANVRARGLDAVADEVVARWFTPAASPALVAVYRAMLASAPVEGYAACCEAVAGWDFRGRLGDVRAETLVIAGAEDPATPPSHAELIRDGIASSRLTMLDGAAHLGNVERADAFASLVAAHVSAPVKGVA